MLNVWYFWLKINKDEAPLHGYLMQKQVQFRSMQKVSEKHAVGSCCGSLMCLRSLKFFWKTTILSNKNSEMLRINTKTKEKLKLRFSSVSVGVGIDSALWLVVVETGAKSWKMCVWSCVWSGGRWCVSSVFSVFRSARWSVTLFSARNKSNTHKQTSASHLSKLNFQSRLISVFREDFKPH